jgi:abortive infection bacteriophage resistance protein
MKYTKPVLSVADGVARLQNKGLAVTDVAGAEKFLRAVGYFRFRGYALPFMQQAPAGFAHGTRQFMAGTQFGDVQNLYEFDRSLRNLVMEQIDRIEVAVRTAILQELNSTFGPHWYTDFSQPIFKDRHDQAKWFGDVAREVERSKHQFITHYTRTYTSPLLPPSWAVAECLSFGKWSALYTQLNHGKGAIAATFGLSPPVLESWLHSLNVLRNACAHHGRIWNRSLPFEPKPHPRHVIHFAAPAKFYARASVIRILTSSIDGNCLFADGLRYLLSNVPGVNPTVMGFPAGWERDPLWT